MMIQDRRIIKERRLTSVVRRWPPDPGSLIVAILPPEQQAQQVERIYERIPREARQAMGLTYEHVRAVLDALR